MTREKKPKISMDDLHLANDGYTHTFHASWQESGVIAQLTLDIVERSHWQPGQYRKHAYELIGSINTVSGRPIGTIQEKNALMLLRELRTRVLTAMMDAGWQEVATTREGKPIYQYHPIPHHAAEEARLLSNQELPDFVFARAGAGVADDAQRQETGQDHDEQLEPERPRSHVVEVIGSEEAKERGQLPAYTRIVSTREVTFTCIVCGSTVTQQRYPGHTPLYCSAGCQGERQRERTRERVARYREKKAAANKTSQEGAMPSVNPNVRTQC